MSLTNDNDGLSKCPLYSTFVNILTILGCTNVYPISNVIQFTKYNINYFIQLDSTDQSYYRIVIPIVNHNKDFKTFEIIDGLNAKYKVVKAFFIPKTDNLWICAEQFVNLTYNLTEIVDKLLNVLNSYFNDFKNQINKN